MDQSSTTRAVAAASARTAPSSSSSAAAASGGTAAVEALALLKVVAAQLQGPSGAALREAITTQAVSNDDVRKVAGLAQALAALVEPPPSSQPPPRGLLGQRTEEGMVAISSFSRSSSGFTTEASTDSFVLSSSSSSSSSLGLLGESIDNSNISSSIGSGGAPDGGRSDRPDEQRLLLTPPRPTSITVATMTAAGVSMQGKHQRWQHQQLEQQQQQQPQQQAPLSPATAATAMDVEEDDTASAASASSASESFPALGSHHHHHLSPPSSPSSRPPASKRPTPLPSCSSSAAAPMATGGGGKVGIGDLPDGTLLYIFDLAWSGRPSYGESDGRKQLGDIALVCRQWRSLAHSDELWKPLCIARWPWLKSLKGGPAELLPPLAAYKRVGEGQSPKVWHEFCVRHGRCMSRAGIGRRAAWGQEYALSVEIFDRKGGFRLFCSYGRVSVMQQHPTPDGRWLTKLAITGFASCWHFSAASRDPTLGRFASVKEYLERSHERGLEHCLCTEVTAMHKETGKMALLYASSKETKRRMTAEKGGTVYYEEELRPATTTITQPQPSMALPAAASAALLPGGGPDATTTTTGGGGSGELLSYLAASGMAVSKVLPPGADPTAPLTPEEEKEMKYRVDRLYLILSTGRRWDVNKIFAGLDWA